MVELSDERRVARKSNYVSMLTNAPCWYPIATGPRTSPTPQTPNIARTLRCNTIPGLHKKLAYLGRTKTHSLAHPSCSFVRLRWCTHRGKGTHWPPAALLHQRKRSPPPAPHRCHPRRPCSRQCVRVVQAPLQCRLYPGPAQPRAPQGCIRSNPHCSVCTAWSVLHQRQG